MKGIYVPNKAAMIVGYSYIVQTKFIFKKPLIYNIMRKNKIKTMHDGTKIQFDFIRSRTIKGRNIVLRIDK